MNRPKVNKLNFLVSQAPKNTVLTSTWLSRHGFYKQLVSVYQANHWLRKVGQEAYVKTGEEVNWPGAVCALQYQLGLPVHVGGVTALELRGLSQNLTLNASGQVIALFNTSVRKCSLPKWFKDAYSNHRYFQLHLFEDARGVETQILENVTVRVSSPEQAILEILALTPTKCSYEQANYLIENLQLLRPPLLQTLLEQCKSIKVKRLFLYLAEKYQLPCVAYLDVTQFNLGSGKRTIGEGGVYVSKYQLSVPKIAQEEAGIGDV